MEAFENGANDINTATIIATSATRSWEEGAPYMRIVEQPHPTLYRFRYKSEGRLAGSIPGINWTDNKKTVPTIEVLNYTGSIDILVSCVTVDEPYLQHPHKLVGKKNSKHGVYCIHLRGPPMQAALNNVGIRCVRKDGIEKSLQDRKENINFDPFGGGYNHKDPNVNLSAVRLCFQGFIPIGPKRHDKLQPVISEPITDKKHVYELIINRLCSCSDKSSGGTEILMFCSPLLNADVQIRFYEEKHGDIVWEAFAKFEKTDVHLKCGIAFRTPPYRDANIEEPVEVLLQIVRFSTDTSTSARMPLISQSSHPIPFTYYPDPDRLKRLRLEGQVQKMHNWINAPNNLEQATNVVANNPTTAQNQVNLNAMDFYDNMDGQTENTAASTNHPFNSTVEPLVDSQSQMEYQLQQLLQIWQSELPMPVPEVQPDQSNTHQLLLQQPQQLHQPGINQQQYNIQFDPHHQQTQYPIIHPNQCQTQPMHQAADQYQMYPQQSQSQDPYTMQQHHHTSQQQHFGQMQAKQPEAQFQSHHQIAPGQVQDMQMQYHNDDYN